MTPDFALFLSVDGITLLRRVPGGWARVADVSLASDDLNAVMADLRSQANALSPQGHQVKLVIPNDQIKYLSVSDTGQSDDALDHQARAALDGATPYAVDELRYDVVRRNGTVFVAAVAKDTLAEAETFAQTHGFEPVCCVATADADAFWGEVFFGGTAQWAGPTPRKDSAAIKIVDAPSSISAPLDGTVPEGTAPDPADAAPRDTAHAGAEPETPGSDTAAPPATPQFASIRASRTAPMGPKAPAVAPVGAPVTGKAAATIPPAQAPSRLLTAKRGSPPAPAAQTGQRADTPPAGPGPAPTSNPAPAASAAITRIAALYGKDATAPADDTTAEDERSRMTVFGARGAPQIGGKPRFLGLILTSALLVMMLAVAAWASVYLSETVSRLFGREVAPPAIAALPEVEPDLLTSPATNVVPDAAQETFEDETDIDLAALDLTVADLDGADLDGSAPIGLSNILPPSAALTEEEAEALYAETGIWLRAPDGSETPSQTSLDDLYIASIDGRVQQFDAVALPELDALRGDVAYPPRSNPAAAGTRFELDDRGLVIATPEGATNPDGVRVFAGLPPVVPPARPSRDAPPDAVTVNDDVAALPPAFAQIRPRLRPDGLVEDNERAQLGGRTRAELAALRPKLRPETLKAEAEEAQPDATEFAVAQSMTPVRRPDNFSEIVTRARSAQPQQSAAQVEQVAAVAPRNVQPRIPSSASVARQATVQNAINLRRLNLIGIYGKPSDRRALVRMPDGRYRKVEVGDRLDGGRVAAIGEDELRYSKNGRSLVLEMPDG